MSLNLPFGIRPINPLANLDDRYGPWATCSDALSATTGTRCVGLTVGIIESSAVVEYWFSTGTTDTDLVEKITGGGTGTITGGTNGLSAVGANIILGGTPLTGGTTIIDGDGISNFTFDNIVDFQITPSGSSAITFGIDENGLVYTFTGGSITYDDNGGIKYGTDYSTNYTARSLIDKGYADAILSGLKPKQAVVAATVSGITLSGLTTIDGVAIQNGDRVLVKDQISGETNGIYITSGGTWSRSLDFDGSPAGEVTTGSYMWVLSGDTQANTSWVLVTEEPITVGTTPLQFVYFNHVSDVLGGHGITVVQSGATHILSVDGASLVGNSLKWSGTTGNETFNVDVTGGTLGTALNSKLDIDVYTGYTATSINNIENLGSGATVYSGSSGQTAYFRTLVASGDTSVTVSGDSLVIYSSSGGSGYYTGAPITAIEVGGITGGTNISGCSFTQLWEALLIPTLQPDFNEQSSSILLIPATGTLCEIGATITTLSVTSNFSRGSYSPVYCGGTPYGSGLPNTHTFTGAGSGISGSTGSTSLSIVKSASNYNVVIGCQCWTTSVDYDAGVAATDSKGGVSTCPVVGSGTCGPKIACIVGYYPLWATCDDITIPLERITTTYNMATANNVIIPLITETPTDKQKFEIPCAWLGSPTNRPLLGIGSWDPSSSQWKYQGDSAGASLGFWNLTSATETVQTIPSIGYCQYTYNGPQRGAVCIRLEF